MAIDLERFFRRTRASKLERHHTALRAALLEHYENRAHGKQQEWDDLINASPNLDDAVHRFDKGCIEIQLPENQLINQDAFRAQLRAFLPWRKGPFNLLGVEIDTEWRSDWKWQRIRNHITPLENRQVIDIGTGNGYFLYRMLGEGAKLALGIDPTRLFLYQFEIMQKLLPANDAYLLPLRSEHLPAFVSFDTVFSLGVLYHRRSPVDHITELMSFIRPGGEIVLETLVVPGDAQTILVPRDRYAKMSNVWFLPSTLALENLLNRAGLINIRTVDVNQTSIDEQRATEWMEFQSLKDFLDPKDPSLTAEGYPAPTRAVVIANKAD